MFNNNEEDIDELDDEVAMISNKKQAKKAKKKDVVSTEDIKLQFVDEKGPTSEAQGRTNKMTNKFP